MLVSDKIMVFSAKDIMTPGIIFIKTNIKDINMKLFLALNFIVALAVCGYSGTIAPVEENGNRIFKSDDCRIVIGKNGYISSIDAGGTEFLANSKAVPGPSYLCGKNGVKSLTGLSVQEDGTLKGSSDQGEVLYGFGGNSLSVKLKAFQESVHFYMIVSSDVKKLEYMANGGDVPTITAPPAKASCTVVRLYSGGNCLDISGVNSIWGPWKGFQVIDISLKKDVERVLTIKVSHEGKIESAKEEKSAPLKKMSSEFSYSKATDPEQIPLCMIGDSITWAGEGDYWRKYLLEEFPAFAFIGTHSAKFGYSHAGEGGNSIQAVLKRMNEIPDCPYYSLLIGTNNGGVRDESKIPETASRNAEGIKDIVVELLKKKGVEKVFLCSILPCFTDNPLRDKTNSEVNKILRSEFEKGTFPAEKVVWIEFEEPIRKIPGWEKIILLHPKPDGYKIIAKIHADAIRKALGRDDKTIPVPHKNTGVRVSNLWDKKLNSTEFLIIPGWYTLSFEVKEVSGDKASVKLHGPENLKNRFDKSFSIKKDDQGKRVHFEVFTSYEGYGYAVSGLSIDTENCVIDNILFEKRRSSGLASTYGEGVYFDSSTKPAAGELVETVK